MIRLTQGPTGELHGQMHKLARNPFRTAFMRRNFDAAVKTYDEKGRTFFYPSGKRCVGSAWAHRFWQGFDGHQQDWTGHKESAAYALFRAGQEVSRAIERHNAQLRETCN